MNYVDTSNPIFGSTSVNTYGPQTENSKMILEQKYLLPGGEEDFPGMCTRVASTLQENDKHGEAFADMLLNMRFLPGGRILAGIGSSYNRTSLNCFLAPSIHDSLGGILDVVKAAGTTLAAGGGVGYDFSTIRPIGDEIRGVGSQTSGVVSFMNIFDSMCHTISSAGNRRGAQMGSMLVSHPEIEGFIDAKQITIKGMEKFIEETTEAFKNVSKKRKTKIFEEIEKLVMENISNSLTAFNISVMVTDKFMECLEQGKQFPLEFNNKIYRYVDPEYLYEKILRNTYDYAEPGILYEGTMNRKNPLYYEPSDLLRSTNPCAEIPLPENGSCLLGSFNLTQYIIEESEGYFV